MPDQNQHPKEELKCGHLSPPPDAVQRIIENDRKRVSINPFMRFCKNFFLGEGY